ncbi:MAG: 23S rRNA (uracil(1939)-C(5))-methyltransferase RlmD, partial [Clostridia bacterium]|nr:23S rRNA (uracil(1939)-C(5))-methyltransferase RlmD [Clostridia bacterium]
MKEYREYKEKKSARTDTAPVCEMRRSCGGCQTWNLTYEEELSMKMGKLIRALGRFGHVEEIIPMEDPYHYRN